MSLPNGHPSWATPSLHHTNSSRSLHQLDDGSARHSTPVNGAASVVPEAPTDPADETRRVHFADLFRRTEDRIPVLFGDDGSYNFNAITALRANHIEPTTAAGATALPLATDHDPIQEPPLKKAKRSIDEDDYDDDDDDEEEEDTLPATAKLQNAGVASALLSPSKSGSSPAATAGSPGNIRSTDRPVQGKDEPETAGLQSLEEARVATEQAARRNFHTIFHTLENDHMAVLEQQQLEDSEKQLQAEMDNNDSQPQGAAQVANTGSLSSANLGASSLTLKHLIARIDMKRDQVRASDAELRLLMNEVRKNRSKWASEENVNQEDLYEALDKVLTELKAHTEYSTPFLQRVNKRDAPDYYSLIRTPMDLGTMTKKLKSLAFKSKTDFVTDLNLIWDNCLRYNRDMNHPLRRMANGMRKEAEKLIPLIPDLVIRPRAEVEAEERRKQNGGDDDAGEDSDDEPIMSSRGRKAGTKGTNKSRKAPSDQKEDTPVVDQKPILQLNGLLGKPGREGSETIDGSNGFATPPIGGSSTPGPLNGHSGLASNADAMDIDGPSLNGMSLNQVFDEAAEHVYENEEYQFWKQMTKKDRATCAKERSQAFKDIKLNIDSPALLRSKHGMRHFMKQRMEAESHHTGSLGDSTGSEPSTKEAEGKPSETLAEGIEEEQERVVPDYYNSLSNIPDVPAQLQWVEDSDGQVVNHHEEFLHVIEPGLFTAPNSRLSKKLDENIHQMQETRKLITKISVIKQMQVQTQVYSNQFPKSNTERFYEKDIDPHFIADVGPVMAAETCQSALKRSIAKILYAAGFEEVQPLAVDTFTGVAADHFEKLIRTFNIYKEAEKRTVQTPDGRTLHTRYTPEEIMLHTLDENGHDLAGLEAFAKDDVDRMSTKLGGLHERMKIALTDMLRPALAPEAGQDGVGAFKDGSDQFMSGDFADDLGEDFFGFKALGLDREMGLDSFAVPFHLLQSRVRNQYQMQNQQTVSDDTIDVFDGLPPLQPVTREVLQDQIGLIKNFFLAKLHANGDQPLVEDEELPTKQRKPRPRLGASGKIVSAQKRPPKEQLALAKKKKKLEAQAAEARRNPSPEKPGSTNTTPAKRKLGLLNGTAAHPAVLALAPGMERQDSMNSQGGASQTDKDDAIGMMSPESIAAQ